MPKVTPATLAVLIPLSISLSVVAGCASVVPKDRDLGSSVAQAQVDRTIVVRPSTDYVNVDDGQTIRFVVQSPGAKDTTFTWRFRAGRYAVGDLRTIAPPGTLTREVRIYVGLNPLYF